MKTLFLLLILCHVACAEWHIEAAIGAVHNFETILEFGQQRIDADYQTRPFEGPLYYSIRTGGSRWDVELIHQKIFLENAIGDLEKFGISHGYNLLVFNYQWHASGFIVRAGLGPMIVHPEVRFRGRVFEPGYNMTGPAFQLSVQKKIHLPNRLFLSGEAKFTAARARFKIDEFDVSAPNIALHALFGFGITL
jgi:hypothetical protein